jgi:hypothetical protein
MCHLIYSFLATFFGVAFFAAVLGAAFLVVVFFSAFLGAALLLVSNFFLSFLILSSSDVFIFVSFFVVLAATFFRSIDCILTAVKSCL